MSDTVTIATRVPAEFAEAVSYFAEKDHCTVSQYTRAALARRAAAAIKDHVSEAERQQQMVGLMKIALRNGSWKQLAEEDPDTYPATREEWQVAIKKSEATVETVLQTVREMDERLNNLGVRMLY